jgi:2-dehydropantoate 2-reductase
MRFIVYGAGGIGSTIGGHLFRTGHDVVLVANPRHVDKIREAGLRLVTPDETYVLKIPVCKEAKELAPFHSDDVALLTAKSQHTLLCLGQLKNAGASRNLPIFCCQNSIVNESIATRVFDRVYGVLLVMPAIFLEPGEVINPITTNHGFIEVGLYPRGVDDLASTVWAALSEAGFVGGVNEWVMRAKGGKCLGNLANAMGAITDERGGDSEFMFEARREAEKVWRSAGIEWEDLESFNKRVRARRGVTNMPKGHEGTRNLSSSWQSLMRETGSIEAEELNGDVVKLGRLLSVPTPYNEVLFEVAEEMALRREKPGKYTV